MTTGLEPNVPEPDDKDWTWVLDRPCPDCGYDASTVARAEFGSRSLDAIAVLRQALTRTDAAVRPEPAVWSPLEYGAHVRDVCVLFRTRLNLLLDQDDPLFANWDQDETALSERYWEQDPARVSTELDAAAHAMAGAMDQVDPDQWQRPGRRSNGSVFTTDTLCRYFLHDLVHHAHDVSR
jgi:DinB superfamily